MKHSGARAHAGIFLPRNGMGGACLQSGTARKDTHRFLHPQVGKLLLTVRTKHTWVPGDETLPRPTLETLNSKRPSLDKAMPGVVLISSASRGAGWQAGWLAAGSKRWLAVASH